MAQFSPLEHPGLRVGSFGEAYFNFGIPAVILVGLISGSLLRFVDMRVKEAIVHHPRSVRVYSYFILMAFFGVVTNSVNFASTYSTLLLLFLGVMLIIISRFIKLPLA
jgi:hypothetical protein